VRVSYLLRSASILYDKVRNVKVYYVYRGPEGSTNMKELNTKKLADEVIIIEDILLIRPNEVLDSSSYGCFML
jgi:IS4 transposase